MKPLLCTVAGLLLLGSAALPSRPVSCKPTPPLRIEASIVGDPAAPFGITARASSPTGAPVELEVVLPDGVTRLAGETKACGRGCEVKVDARAADRSRREILVRAAYSEGTARVTRVVPLVLFDTPRPARRPVKNGRGESILEFAP